MFAESKRRLGQLWPKLCAATGPLIQLDHVECCNDIQSSSSDESVRTHARRHADTAMADTVNTKFEESPRSNVAGANNVHV